MALKLSLDFLNDPKKGMLISISSLLILAVLFYNLLFKHQFSQIKKVSPQLAQLRQKVKTAEAELAKIAVYQKQFEELKAKIEACKKRLPYEKEMSGLLEHLSRTAKETGVKILAIEPVNPDAKAKQETQEKGGLFLEVPIKIDALAGYHQLGIFINRLENSERFMKVSDLTIEKGDESPKIHSTSLVISVYVLLQELKI